MIDCAVEFEDLAERVGCRPAPENHVMQSVWPAKRNDFRSLHFEFDDAATLTGCDVDTAAQAGLECQVCLPSDAGGFPATESFQRD